MILYKCPQLKLFWYEVPKTGCTSLKVFFQQKSNYSILSVKCKHLYGHRNYFQFAFVRNPWDRLVSCFFDKTKRTVGSKWQLRAYVKYIDSNFTEFVHGIATDDVNNSNIHHRLQYNLINHDYLNFIGKFENLQKDFDFICYEVGVSDCELPHWNKTQHEHYTEYYDDETRSIVAEKYAKDIEYFGYKFGN